VDDLNLITEIFRTLGPSSAAFAIMWLWMKDQRKNLEVIREELKGERDEAKRCIDRIEQIHKDRLAEVQATLLTFQALRERLEQSRPSRSQGSDF
jgi:hypothetical protein